MGNHWVVFFNINKNDCQRLLWLPVDCQWLSVTIHDFARESLTIIGNQQAIKNSAFSPLRVPGFLAIYSRLINKRLVIKREKNNGGKSIEVHSKYNHKVCKQSKKINFKLFLLWIMFWWGFPTRLSDRLSRYWYFFF